MDEKMRADVVDVRARRTGKVMETDDLLCSRNARPEKDGEREWPGALLARRTRTFRKVLVRCAQ